MSSNTNPLRIFTEEEIDGLLRYDVQSLRENKTKIFRSGNAIANINGHDISKTDVNDIFDLLDNHLLSTVAKYRYQAVPDFLDNNDILLFYKLHPIPFEKMDPDLSVKIYDLIATKVNELLPEIISSNDLDKGIIVSISKFFDNLTPRHNQKAFSDTYKVLDDKINFFIENYPKPFNRSFLKGGSTELMNLIRGNTYEVLNEMPDMFDSIKDKYGNWIANGMSKVKVGETKYPTKNEEALYTLAIAARVASDYKEPGENIRKSTLIEQQLLTLGGRAKEKVNRNIFLIWTVLVASIIAAFIVYNNKASEKYEKEKLERIEQQRTNTYGLPLKIHEAAKTQGSIYENIDGLNMQTIMGDYLGAHPKLINAELLSDTLIDDYVKQVYIVNDLPSDLKNINEYIDIETINKYPNTSRDVIQKMILKSDSTIYSEHTMKVDFPNLNSKWKPDVRYGYEPGVDGFKSTVQIKKLKANDFKFKGKISQYFVGSNIPYRSQDLLLWYDLDKLSYMYQGAYIDKALIDVDALKIYNQEEGEILDEYRFASVVNNIKLVQNKMIRKGGYYSLKNATHTLSNLDLEKDLPLREVVFEDTLLKNKGTSIADGKSYLKMIMKHSQVGLIVDVDGYIEQYQQVIIDKERGVLEKIVLIRK